MSKTIFWFKKDLRLLDNKGFYHACKENQEILPLFILDTSPTKWQIGGAQKWWLHHSLLSLQKELKDRGLDIYCFKGDPKKIIQNLIYEHKISRFYYNLSYEYTQKKLEEEIKNSLLENQVEVFSYNSSLLSKPWEIQNKSGEAYKVFSQFWKALNLQDIKPEVYPVPQKFPDLIQIKSEDLVNWNLLPKKPNWAKKFDTSWQVGEKAAHKKLEEFIKEKNLESYHLIRDFPSKNGTSKLSVYLHFGEISPHFIWKACKDYFIKNKIKPTLGLETYLRELGWREFSYYLIYHNPNFDKKNFNEKFDKLKWENNLENLKIWQKGLTGYPIIDAAMRQLWHVGWMHNRLRMVVGSFLTKHLQIHWLEGSKWFWDTLVDADLANNSAGWQWVAGSGADAQPYFRIFNPIIQSKKFDPKGNFIRKWIPELSKLSNEEIHTPWEIPKESLEKADIKLGETYPFPIVNHREAREKALKNFENTR